MTDMSNVIQLRPAGDDAGDDLACRCGSRWFKANVCLSTDMALSALNDLRCHECGDFYPLGGTR